ncbi:uncharacterized protein [Gossypium hirsutum]|uniref:Retrotransposon gag domain-containing protein n=1 Tax=Gossypium hirsutum TaxID=3635 RepID=A0A1U8HMY8_GOSHI|nr:uncharacterized protein LOC107887666 [Gossypium hirsutum]
MDQRLEKLEQMQKEMQEQLQAQMQEELVRIQQEMRDQLLESQKNMLESQNNMMSQLTQLLKGGSDKGKGPIGDIGNDNDDSACPTSFTPVNIQTQPPRVSVNVKPLYQAGTSAPVNFPTGSCSNPEDNVANPTIPDFDEVEGEKELSLVPDLVLPPKFKMPEFERYNGTSCPEAHITMFCRRMTGYVNNDQFLIHCFQDSLTGAAAKWYNQLSRAQVKSWNDLVQAFMKQYDHVTYIVPDRITLQNMEKRSGESFKKYAQR